MRTLVECGVPDTACPWDNCDTCEVGAAWLEQYNKDRALELEAIKETADMARRMYKEHGPEHEETKKATFIKRACARMEPMPPAGHECPQCRHRFAKGVNFCSACGQRITWKVKKDEEHTRRP